VDAITANPSIREDELAAVIAHANPNLTPGQSFGRAAALAAWERKARCTSASPVPDIAAPHRPQEQLVLR
jgi:hypothetical protein